MAFAGESLALQNVPEEIKTRDYTLKLEVLGQGLSVPWGITFIDARHALITEKRGTLRMMIDGKLMPDAVEGTPEVRDMGQGGLMDVAIDPDYSKAGGADAWVYLGFNKPAAQGNRGHSLTSIVRGKIRDGKWTDNQVLWEGKAEHYTGSGVHFGTRIVFDREGKLFFAIGDRGNQSQSQDKTRPNGKMHRINRDGSIPSDNPFVNEPGAQTSLFTLGNRNIQGISMHPETGQIWSCEHGPRGGDELNLMASGKNYGWPVITYGINYNGTPITDKTEAPGMEQPATYWVPSIAVCGMDFYSGDRFAKWNNHLFIGALAGRQVRRVVIEDGKVIEQEKILADFGKVRDVQTSPDGFIYLVLNQPDVIVRVSPK